MEKAYQASKTHDPDIKRVILNAKSPGEAKRMGSHVALRSDWKQVNIGIVRAMLCRKFADPTLRRLLLATGDQELQEGNWHGDGFWGVDLRTGQGLNWLGVLLMAERARIREDVGRGDAYGSQGGLG